MLGGGDEDTLAHQAGGVADFRDIAAGGGDGKSVEVRAAKDHAGAGGGWKQPHVDGRPTVQSNAGELKGRGNGMFQMR